MKKKFIFFLFTLFISTAYVNAQRGLKIAYIDMDYILENIPEYQEANQQLNSKVQKWKSEIELKMKAVDDLKQTLENERALLTHELIEEREEEIAYEEKIIVEYQQQRFGPQGDLIVQKRQLVQPIQDQVFNAVQEIGDTRQYDFIFENSADALMLFSAQRHDISDQILAFIQRSSRKLDVEKRKEEKEKEIEEVTNEPYKSVERAAVDKKEDAERQAQRQEIIDQRESEMNDRQRARDSARAAKKKEYEERRARMLEERERKRDSIQKAREDRRNN